MLSKVLPNEDIMTDVSLDHVYREPPIMRSRVENLAFKLIYGSYLINFDVTAFIIRVVVRIDT